MPKKSTFWCTLNWKNCGNSREQKNDPAQHLMRATFNIFLMGDIKYAQIFPSSMSGQNARLARHFVRATFYAFKVDSSVVNLVILFSFVTFGGIKVPIVNSSWDE